MQRAFVESMKTIAQTAIEKAGFDKTRNGKIVGVNSITNTYSVKVDGIVYNNVKPKIISIFKGYSYDDELLYLDYYYSNVSYDDNKDNNDERIYLHDMKNIVVKELMYSDIFDDDNVASKYDDYIEYFDTVRYVFKYDKSRYLFSQLRLLED